MNMTKAVRSLILFLLAGAIAISAMGLPEDAPLSKEEIIHKAWRAMFGQRQNADIRSIYVEGFFHGRTKPSRMTVRRPNLFRNETPSGVLVFDGRRAAWAKREADKDGKAQGPEMIPPAQWKHFEVDIALLFPACFDHPAEMQGGEKVNGNDAYKLFVRLPLGASVTYYIDSRSFLITRRLVRWEGEADPQPWENMLDNYVNLDGIHYPDGYSFAGREGKEKGFYKNVRFNIETANELFQIPAEL